MRLMTSFWVGLALGGWLYFGVESALGIMVFALLALGDGLFFLESFLALTQESRARKRRAKVSTSASLEKGRLLLEKSKHQRDAVSSTSGTPFVVSSYDD